MSSEFKSVLHTNTPITGGTHVVGVFGYPVEHSRSPAMHNAAFATLELPFVYVPFSVHPENLPAAIRGLPALGIVGVNLTIPHKEAVIGLIDEITPEAREVGAVNTIHCTERGMLGDNTDGYGFYKPLEDIGYSAAGARAVIIGAGGAARSAVFRLVREGAQVTIVNRSPERGQALAEAVSAAGYSTVSAVAMADHVSVTLAISAANLIVNTTRAGMYPETEQMPDLPFEALGPSHLIYDLIYNPLETRLLRLAAAKGCRVLNGVMMLVYQGASAFHRWTGVVPPVDIMKQAVIAPAA